jgi:hypothetical protein
LILRPPRRRIWEDLGGFNGTITEVPKQWQQERKLGQQTVRQLVERLVAQQRPAAAEPEREPELGIELRVELGIERQPEIERTLAST